MNKNMNFGPNDFNDDYEDDESDYGYEDADDYDQDEYED